MPPKPSNHPTPNAWSTPLKIAKEPTAPSLEETTQPVTVPLHAPTPQNDKSVDLLEEGEIPTSEPGTEASMHAPWNVVRAKSPSNSRPSTPPAQIRGVDDIVGQLASKNAFEALQQETLEDTLPAGLPASPPFLTPKKAKRKLRRTASTALELALRSPPVTKAKTPAFFPYVVTDSPMSKKRAMARRMRNTSASAPPPLPSTSESSPTHTTTTADPTTENHPSASIAETTVTVKVEEDDEAILWDGSCFDLTFEEEEQIKAIEDADHLKHMVVDVGAAANDAPLAGPSMSNEDHDVDIPDAPSAPPAVNSSAGINQGAPFLMLDEYGQIPIICPQPQHRPNYSLPDLPTLLPSLIHIEDSSPPSSPSPGSKAKTTRHASHPPTISQPNSRLKSPFLLLHNPNHPEPGPPAFQINIPTHPLLNLCSPPPPSHSAHTIATPARIRLPPPSLESTSSSIPISDFIRRRALIENDVDDGNTSDDEDDEDTRSRVISRLPHTPRTVILYKEKASIPGKNWTKPTHDDPFKPLLNLNFAQLEVWPTDPKHAVILNIAGQGCPRPTEEVQVVKKARDYLTTAEMFLYGDNNPPHCFLLRGFGKATKEFLLDLQCVSTAEATLFFSPNNPPVDNFIMTLSGFRTPKAKRILKIINAGLDTKPVNANIIRITLNQPQFTGMAPSSIVSEVRDSLRIQIVLVTDKNGVQSQFVHVFMNLPTSDPYQFRTLRGIMTSAKFTDPYITMNIRVVHDWCCALCNSMLHQTDACFLVTEPGWIVNANVIANAKNSNSNAPPPPPPPPPAAIAMTVRGGTNKGKGRGSGSARGQGGQGAVVKAAVVKGAEAAKAKAEPNSLSISSNYFWTRPTFALSPPQTPPLTY
ncbi:hypothetical protein BC629DRAFT_1589203 [Irpex lacteus]|nr:hypothetical protein BC629DRAFT_1589203 [Irpex lacteus]